jgi:hypothetical protein
MIYCLEIFAQREVLLLCSGKPVLELVSTD